MNPDCQKVRENILRIATESRHGHIPTCFSIVEILFAVYGTMRHRPTDPCWDQRDVFVLSKGHGALAHYCALSHEGYFPLAELYGLGAFGSRFGCHADRVKVPGVEVSTGSLGHGIGVAVGIALAFRIAKSARRVFVLVGDGEANEGSVWEAVMVAVHQGMNNLTILYDDNRSHGRGLQITRPGDQFRGFGCSVAEVDGHSLPELEAALERSTEGVKAIVARTEKGHGCRTLVDNHYEWHGKTPSPEELAMLLGELHETTI